VPFAEPNEIWIRAYAERLFIKAIIVKVHFLSLSQAEKGLIPDDSAKTVQNYRTSKINNNYKFLECLSFINFWGVCNVCNISIEKISQFNAYNNKSI
jgi:hypothetical protein